MSLRRHRRRRRSLKLPSSETGQNPIALLVHRAVAIVALGVVLILSVAELWELHGELAFARFLQVRQLADKCDTPAAFAGAVDGASADAEVIMAFGRRNPDALREVTMAFLTWSVRKELEPTQCLRLGEVAVQAAALAVRAAPSDYEPWLWLAQAQYVLGLRPQADLCFKRARELAPLGMQLRLFRT